MGVGLQAGAFVRITPDDVRAGDLLVVAPTGSGKTTRTLRAALELVPREYRRVVFLAPTRALMFEIAEKARAVLREKYGPAGAQMVGVDNSDAKLDPGWRFQKEWSKPIVVTSYERFDALVTRDPEILRDSIIVVDEAHNLLDPQRATAIIDILANVKMMREKGAKVRVILLSATMPEVESLARYLGARVIAHNVRPVELKVERREVGVYGMGSQPYYFSKIDEVVEAVKRYPKPVLVYVPSRRWSEWVAEVLSGKGFKAVPFHAGMPFKERLRIQQEMQKPNPSIDVVVATDTLSQGVNMSFRTVVIPGLKRFLPGGFEYVDPAIIRQVMGRAGRPQYGYNEGYVVIIEAPDEKEVVDRALKGLYGEVREPGDYIGLVLRLLATGRNPQVWARYAYKVDGEKVEYALELLKSVGLVKENGELHPLGALLAREYVHGRAIPVLLAYHKLESMSGQELEDWRRVDPVTRAFLYAASTAYYMTGAWSRLKDFESRLANLPLTYTYDILSMVPVNRLANLLWSRLGVGDEFGGPFVERLSAMLKFVDAHAPAEFHAPEMYILALFNPDKVNVDNDLEALRKASEVLAEMASAGLLPREYLKPARMLEKAARVYRRLLRDLPAGDAKAYLPAMLKALSELAKEGVDVPEEVVEASDLYYRSLVKACRVREGDREYVDWKCVAGKMKQWLKLQAEAARRQRRLTEFIPSWSEYKRSRGRRTTA